MILKNNINPTNLIYYKASFILEILNKERTISIDMLYQEVELKTSMDYLSFVKCMDWLYLIDSIYTKEENGVVICLLKN